MKAIRKPLLLVVLLVFATSTVAADGDIKVYRTQFLEMHKKVSAMLDRVKALKESTDKRTRLNLQQEMFALVKLTHRLEEEAAQANLDKMQRGADADKTLLGISLGCKAIDFTLKSLDNFVSTSDRSFLVLAHDGEALIKGVAKAL